MGRGRRGSLPRKEAVIPRKKLVSTRKKRRKIHKGITINKNTPRLEVKLSDTISPSEIWEITQAFSHLHCVITGQEFACVSTFSRLLIEE